MDAYQFSSVSPCSAWLDPIRGATLDRDLMEEGSTARCTAVRQMERCQQRSHRTPGHVDVAPRCSFARNLSHRTPISSTVGRQTRVGGADCSTTVYGAKLGRHAGKLYRDVIVLATTTG
uniref:Uncharacterized protein n=1 Tax=Anopheles culicifacies TaxID=139723 RepID=A0A182MDP0_9DIPT